ncbi:MAG: ATP-binding cassette domain-containing protein [Holosporales bacterium]|jgi:ATPase subunit of ABC transporter with duplicated ATPase domains|nr:ATP-binding cassette domain-containing protein [Holosporales bacterium]
MIKIKELSLSFSHKICFENFSTIVNNGERIAIIGRNGSGKSTLLKMIAKSNPSVGYVPQIITNSDSLSGGEKFNAALSKAINYDALLLDEPTNHLDLDNRKGLMKMLKRFNGTLIIVTHDLEILRNCIQKIWHIDDGKIRVFQGKYDDYIAEILSKRESILRQIEILNTREKAASKSLIKEQERISKSISSGQKKVANKKWMKAVGDLKGMKAEKSQGAKLKSIDSKKQDLQGRLKDLRLPEVIVPKFSIPINKSYNKTLIYIKDASVGYPRKVVLNKINLSITFGERVSITGNNGSGKTTLIRGILAKPEVTRTGIWDITKTQIGYLDQFYGTLEPEKTAFEIIPDRKILNDFLFRKNEEVYNKVKNMSGGEKARLSLALIAFNTPELLILDEITNNIDLETKEHVIQVLRKYPGSILIISHDQDFLRAIEIEKYYKISSFSIEESNA